MLLEEAVRLSEESQSESPSSDLRADLRILSLSNSASQRPSSVRRSLSLLGKLPRELLRSHSHRTPILESHRDYDNLVDSDKRTMHSSELVDDDRQSRKTKKSESRLYHFLTRSRSRSRSKTSTLESVADNPSRSHSRSRNSSLSEHVVTPALSSKPSRISSSRPLSSTTTATNTTIKAQTPQPKTQLMPPSIPEISTAHEPDMSSLTNTTTKGHSGSTRKKLSLFGIPLSRKSSAGSRPSSPGPSKAPEPPSDPAPPLPQSKPYSSTYYDDSHHRSKLKTVRTHPPARPASPDASRPSTSTETDHDSSASTTPSTASKKDRQTRPPKPMAANGFRVSHPRPQAGSSSSHAPVASSSSTRSPSESSQAPNVESSAHRRVAANHSSSSSTAYSSIPRRHHPPSLSREENTSTASTSVVAPRPHYRKNSVESSHRYRPMAMVDEEGGSDDMVREMRREQAKAVEHTSPKERTSPKTNGHPSKSHKTSTLRATKHGSFDFERPGWSSSIARSTSGGSGSTAFDHSQPSGDSPGLRKSSSLSSKPTPRKRTQPPTNVRLNHDATSSGRPSAATVEPGLSSSLGRKTGRRLLGSGIARLVGISHGPFSFEPPVPSPTAGTMSASIVAADRAREKARREAEKAKEAKEKEDRQREKERKRAARRTAQIIVEPHPEPPPEEVNIGFRSGAKGRSLDLGLGLSWAPTTMREDAMMPSSFVFGKSISAPSRAGLARKMETVEVDVDRSQIGREVADGFRDALDDQSYIDFKRYVHRFDSHDIPFDGPTGILARAEALLDRSPHVTPQRKRRLLDSLVRIILQNAS